ncbi:hypothetical protein Gotur_020863 [Gossypium turneri]
MKKLISSPFPVFIIADIDIYKFNPWDLPNKAALGEKEWYFFCPRDKNYLTVQGQIRQLVSGFKK